SRVRTSKLAKRSPERVAGCLHLTAIACSLPVLDAAVAASRMARETGRHLPAPPVRDGRAGGPPCPATGPEGRPVQPGPARGNPLADAHLPAALISRSFRTRQGPAGNGHGFARPEFAIRPGNTIRHCVPAWKPAPPCHEFSLPDRTGTPRPRVRQNPGLERTRKSLFMD
ncbi:MAG: hypothetical protein OXF73_08205, partial [Gammaproteobacteria bacterium]|nr:hypothetical protein [Gammaproteobacteria bacterium]